MNQAWRQVPRVPRGSVGLTLRGPVARRPGRTLYRLAPNQDKPMRSLISYPSIGTWIAGSIGEPVIHAAPQSVSTRQNEGKSDWDAVIFLLFFFDLPTVRRNVHNRELSGLSLVASSHWDGRWRLFPNLRRSRKLENSCKIDLRRTRSKNIYYMLQTERTPLVQGGIIVERGRDCLPSLSKKKRRRHANSSDIRVYISIMIQMILRSHLVVFKGIRLKIKSRYWGTAN